MSFCSEDKYSPIAQNQKLGVSNTFLIQITLKTCSAIVYYAFFHIIECDLSFFANYSHYRSSLCPSLSFSSPRLTSSPTAFFIAINPHIYISLSVSLSHGCSLVCHISAVHVAWGCLHAGHVRRGPIHVHAQQQATLWRQMGSEEEEGVLV